jgi:hypothetical protein
VVEDQVGLQTAVGDHGLPVELGQLHLAPPSSFQTDRSVLTDQLV